MERSGIVLTSLVEALSSFCWVVPIVLILGFLVELMRRDLRKRKHK